MSFLSSPEGPLGRQIFAPTLAKGHGGVKAKISQPACKRFEVKSHSLTLGLSHTEPGPISKGKPDCHKSRPRGYKFPGGGEGADVAVVRELESCKPAVLEKSREECSRQEQCGGQSEVRKHWTCSGTERRQV